MNKLSSLQRQVMLEKGTESAFTGKYVHSKERGVYACANCGEPLFSSEAKFDSKTGWPSFDRTIGKIRTEKDKSQGMVREEVICPACGAHLGHVFDDGPTETRLRYCINSCALDLKRAKTK